MLVPKMVKNGQNSFLHVFSLIEKTVAQRNQEQSQGPEQSLNYVRRNKSHFWTNFGTGMRATVYILFPTFLIGAASMLVRTDIVGWEGGQDSMYSMAPPGLVMN